MKLGTNCSCAEGRKDIATGPAEPSDALVISMGAMDHVHHLNLLMPRSWILAQTAEPPELVELRESQGSAQEHDRRWQIQCRGEEEEVWEEQCREFGGKCIRRCGDLISPRANNL